MWETKEKRRQRTERIRRRKAQGLQNRYLYNYTFASDTRHDSAQLGQARAYVEHWRKAFRDSVGLLLFYNVGAGKAFAVVGIANALLEQAVLVRMTNFPVILNRLPGCIVGQSNIYRQSGRLRSSLKRTCFI